MLVQVLELSQCNKCKGLSAGSLDGSGQLPYPGVTPTRKRQKINDGQCAEPEGTNAEDLKPNHVSEQAVKKHQHAKGPATTKHVGCAARQ